VPVEQPVPSQLSPHRAERVDLAGPAGALAALRAAPTGEPVGLTALLLPGFTGSKEDFAPLLDPISAAGVGVVTIDLPGQNESPGPTNEAGYQPDALGAIVAELIDQLAAEHGRVTLLGHSYGGLVARAAVLAGASVAGLTLLDSGPGQLPDGSRRRVLELGEPALRQFGLVVAQRMREELDATNPDWAAKPPELRAFLRDRMMRTRPEHLLGVGHALRHEPDRVGELAKGLRASGTPCLVVCGERDDAWSVAAQRNMAERLDADFAVIPNAAHSPNIENPKGLLAALLPTWTAWAHA
jgi:pimeloyl-ACP methyl ester carboxylesterase